MHVWHPVLDVVLEGRIRDRPEGPVRCLTQHRRWDASGDAGRRTNGGAPASGQAPPAATVGAVVVLTVLTRPAAP